MHIHMIYACTYQIYTVHMYIHTHIQMHACVYMKININICMHEASTPADLSVTMMWTLAVDHLYIYHNVYMYIYSCKHNVHMYIYLCIHLCICMYKYIHMFVSTYLFVFLCIYNIDKEIDKRQAVSICLLLYAYPHDTHTNRTYVCDIYIHVYTWMYICTHLDRHPPPLCSSFYTHI